VGAFCFADTTPRQLSPELLEGLKLLAKQIEKLLTLRMKREINNRLVEETVKTLDRQEKILEGANFQA
jgi:hypothetical protein